LSTCIVNYGRLVTDAETLKKINCPLLGIFGENDQNINPTVVGTFQDALNKAGIKNKIIIYPGVGHAFMNPDNAKLYNKRTTEEAQKEIYMFLDTYLKQNSK
jgi:carboxymethylenebutenolidase